MAAVASAPSSALDADATTLSRLTASVPAPADASASSADNAHPPPRLLLRLPPQTEIDGRRNPLKRKWRSIVNFFALPIRAYYLEPPGAAYRAELRARRGDFSDQGDGQPTFWPVPAYTDQVGDDEMVLFKAQEEAEALAAMQRDQQANAAAAEAHAQQQQASLDFNDAFTTDNEDDRSEQDEEELASPAMWPQPSPGANTVPAFPSLLAEPSPRYELTDPLADTSLPSQPIPTTPARRVRTRTTSNLSPVAEPSFANGVAMSAADEQHASASYRELRNSYIPQLNAGAGIGWSDGFPLSLEGAAPSLFNVAAQSALLNPALKDFIHAAQSDAKVSALRTKDQRNQVVQDTVLSMPNWKNGSNASTACTKFFPTFRKWKLRLLTG